MPGDSQGMSTFVLAHGAWHGAWCWDRVRPYLTRRGHEVVTPELPSDAPQAGLPEYLATIDAALQPHSGVVLVAHSMSGLAAPLAVANPAVDAVVMLAAMTPSPGKSWLDNGAEPFAEPMRRLAPGLHVDDQARSWWDPADATALFYHDSSPDDAAEAVGMLRRDSSMIYTQPCPEFPARRVPVTYVHCRADRALNGAWNAASARELLDAGQRELPTGHSPFWSAPAELATLLEELAGA